MPVYTACRDQYERTGWMPLPHALSDAELELVRAWADRIPCDERSEWLRYYESAPDGGKVLSRIERFAQPDWELSFLIQPESPITSALAAVLGDEPVLFKDKVNLKPAGGGAYSVHQDGPAYRGFGIDDFLTAMVAIDDATPANGCLEFATSPRARRFLELDSDGNILPAELAGTDFEPVPSCAGDVLIFDGYAVHRSGQNESGSPRRAMFLTFNPLSQGDKRSDYYAAKQQAFPPEEEREQGKDYRAGASQFNLGNPFR